MPYLSNKAFFVFYRSLFVGVFRFFSVPIKIFRQYLFFIIFVQVVIIVAPFVYPVIVVFVIIIWFVTKDDSQSTKERTSIADNFRKLLGGGRTQESTRE